MPRVEPGAMNARACERCGTELAPLALACPACGALVHRDRLRELSDLATRATEAGDRETARQHWHEALALLPATSDQHRVISERIAGTVEPAADAASQRARGAGGSWWKQGLGALVSAGALLLGKLKFLLLGLGKISTIVSMFGFLGVYWTIYGWPLALGLVVSIYIHEMGHVSVLRGLGIHAGAPLFIPGVGAVVMLKERITDPLVDARIGLAGPLWGLGAAIAAGLVGIVTGAPIWFAVSELTAFINLFNLTPVWQLDGSRGFNALSRSERWMAVGIVVAMLLVTHVGILWLVAAAALWAAVRREPGPGHLPTLITYAGLVTVLSLLARNVQ